MNNPMVAIAGAQRRESEAMAGLAVQVAINPLFYQAMAFLSAPLPAFSIAAWRVPVPKPQIVPTLVQHRIRAISADCVTTHINGTYQLVNALTKALTNALLEA